jgi:15-cis-phytoene synthase
MSSLHEAYDYCQALTKREAKNFYYGFMLLPNGQRRAIYSAYAFARQCDDIVDEDLPRGEATWRLREFRRSFEAALDGRPDGLVLQALPHTITKYGVATQHFFDLIDGCEMDLVNTRYETFEQLESYCQHVAASVGLISIEIFGHDGGDKARNYACDLGTALQLTNILRDIQEDSDRGRVYLPQEEVEWFGYSEEELLAGSVSREFRRLMIYQADRARQYFERGRKLLPYLPTRARACVGAMAGIYSTILSDIERDPGVVFRQRVSLGTGHKLALAGKELVRSVVG